MASVFTPRFDREKDPQKYDAMWDRAMELIDNLNEYKLPRISGEYLAKLESTESGRWHLAYQDFRASIENLPLEEQIIKIAEWRKNNPNPNPSNDEDD